jgi:hypothetical protein
MLLRLSSRQNCRGPCPRLKTPQNPFKMLYTMNGPEDDLLNAPWNQEPEPDEGYLERSDVEHERAHEK